MRVPQLTGARRVRSPLLNTSDVEILVFQCYPEVKLILKNRFFESPFQVAHWLTQALSHRISVLLHAELI